MCWRPFPVGVGSEATSSCAGCRHLLSLLRGWSNGAERHSQYVADANSAKLTIGSLITDNIEEQDNFNKTSGKQGRLRLNVKLCYERHPRD